MGMNIKYPVVHAMARELAERRSTSVTDAVRQALRAELERCPNPERPEAICARTSARPEWQGRTSKELQDALYDEDGLPV
jgi:antitoxin VapB